MNAKTLGELYSPAMQIQDQASADACFASLVEYNMTRFGQSRADAEKEMRINLGYWAGYFDNETRERVERLFKCAHPIFGAISEVGAPTPEQAFELGRKMGENLKNQPNPNQ